MFFSGGAELGGEIYHEEVERSDRKNLTQSAQRSEHRGHREEVFGDCWLPLPLHPGEARDSETALTRNRKGKRAA
jgi:hypothetical protein